MFTGYKTLLFSVLVSLLGVATTFNWTSIVNAQTAGYILTGVGIATAALRALTSTAIGKAQ